MGWWLSFGASNFLPGKEKLLRVASDQKKFSCCSSRAAGPTPALPPHDQCKRTGQNSQNFPSAVKDASMESDPYHSCLPAQGHRLVLVRPPNLSGPCVCVKC
jgi:hypothetical protein